MNNHIRITTLGVLSACLLLATGTSFAQIGASQKSQKSSSPHSVLRTYLQALESQNTNPNLPIYTKATREWKKTWKVTPTQMANEARDIKRCGKGQLKTLSKRAVIRYNPANRECSPFYFRKEDGMWRLDFLTMMKTIRFNQRNQWHFSSMQHPFTFAFKDWKFDENGYPHK